MGKSCSKIINFEIGQNCRLDSQVLTSGKSFRTFDVHFRLNILALKTCPEILTTHSYNLLIQKYISTFFFFFFG